MKDLSALLERLDKVVIKADELRNAVRALLDSVREKHNMSKDESFYCPHMQKLEELTK